MPMRRSADVLQDVVEDLQSHEPLTRGLESPEAIYAAHPADEIGYPLGVIVTLISDVGTPHRGVYERDYRIQITAKASRPWLEWRDQAPLVVLSRVLDAVAQRLDRAHGIQEIPRGSETGTGPEELEDNYLALTNDWRVTGFYLD